MPSEAARVAAELDKEADLKEEVEHEEAKNYRIGVAALRLLAGASTTDDEVRLEAALRLVEL